MQDDVLEVTIINNDLLGGDTSDDEENKSVLVCLEKRSIDFDPGKQITSISANENYGASSQRRRPITSSKVKESQQENLHEISKESGPNVTETMLGSQVSPITDLL